MYGIIGENSSDVATLKVLVRRLASNESLSVKTKGYGVRGMLGKGARQFRLFRGLGCTRFIACHDADGRSTPKHKVVAEKIVRPSGIDEGCCIVVPVQELEAWILADIECATRFFPLGSPPQSKAPSILSARKNTLRGSAVTASPGRATVAQPITNEWREGTSTTFLTTQNSFTTNIASPAAFNPVLSNVVYTPPDSKWPYIQNWFLSVQRQLPEGTVLEVAYNGNHSLRLPIIADYNQATPQTGRAKAWGVTARVPISTFGPITWLYPAGDDHYSGLLRPAWSASS